MVSTDMLLCQNYHQQPSPHSLCASIPAAPSNQGEEPAVCTSSPPCPSLPPSPLTHLWAEAAHRQAHGARQAKVRKLDVVGRKVNQQVLGLDVPAGSTQQGQVQAQVPTVLLKSEDCRKIFERCG